MSQIGDKVSHTSFTLHREAIPVSTAMSLYLYLRLQGTKGVFLQDVDARLTKDVERLSDGMSKLIPSMVKPVVDIAWFTAQLTRTDRTEKAWASSTAMHSSA